MGLQRQSHLSPSSTCIVLLFFIHLQSSVAGDCPGDGRTWVPFGNRCYHFVHGEEDKIKVYTVIDAKSHCKGFELVSIQSAEENDFILDYCPQVWKGNMSIWLGMYYDTDSEGMRWHGNQAVDYTNWESDPDPASLVPMDTCATLHSNTGKWAKVSCLTDLENAVVCEAAESPEEEKQMASPLLSALVIVSVLAIMGISLTIWVVHQRHSLGTNIFTAFEYQPPFSGHGADEAYLVETEETEDTD